MRPPPTISAQLCVPDGGLSEVEVLARRRQHGLNRLPEKPPTPLWRVLARFVVPVGILFVFLKSVGLLPDLS